MRVVVENLPGNIQSDQIKREFQRAGSCKVQHNESIAYIDYLDIVNASAAIKMFHNKNFGGKIISVKIESNLVVDLSGKRQRSETEVINTNPNPSIVNLKKDTVSLNGLVYLGGKKDSITLTEDQTAKYRKIEEEKKLVQLSQTGKAESNGSKEKTLIVQTAEKLIKETVTKENTVKEATSKESVKENTVKEATSKDEKGTVKENKEIKPDPVDQKAKEDSLMVEIEGQKFLKTSDDSKLHCIVCNKEYPKKSIKSHIASKGHKSLIA